MSFRITALRRHHLALLILGLLSGTAFAQDPNLPFSFAHEDPVTSTFVQASNLGGTASSGGSSSDDDKWLKVEFHYNLATTPGVPKAANYLDEITFKVWIEARDQGIAGSPPGEGFAVVLTGSVTYVNVPKGKDLYGVVYVHPSTLGRYSTERGTADFDHKFDVHVEASMGGTVVGDIDKNHEDDPTWFQKPKAIPGFVYRQDQTPFMNADPDRYPAIKLRTPSSD